MGRGSNSALADLRTVQLVEHHDRDRVGGSIDELAVAQSASLMPTHLAWQRVDSYAEELPEPDAGGPADWIGRNGVEPQAVAGPGNYQRPEPVRVRGAPWVSTARIMVVDDRADIRELLREYLESEGYTVDALGDATEALRRLAEFRPNVVLLDIRMPGLSGLTALQEIRARHRDVGVIMVTGVGERAVAQQSLALGAFDYVTKPIDFPYLLWSIETYFVTRQVLRELGDQARDLGEDHPRGGGL